MKPRNAIPLAQINIAAVIRVPDWEMQHYRRKRWLYGGRRYELFNSKGNSLTFYVDFQERGLRYKPKELKGVTVKLVHSGGYARFTFTGPRVDAALDLITPDLRECATGMGSRFVPPLELVEALIDYIASLEIKRARE